MKRSWIIGKLLSVFLLAVLGKIDAGRSADGLYFTQVPNSKIEASLLDGSSRRDIISTLFAVDAIALDSVNSKLFYSDHSGTTRRMVVSGIGGSGPITLTDTLLPDDHIFQIAFDAGAQKVYWTEYNSNVVRVSDYNGSNVETLMSGLNGPVGIAVDSADGKLYVGEADGNDILVAEIDGTNSSVLHSGLAGQVLGIAVDSTVSPKQLYYVSFATLNRIDVDGSNPVVLTSSGISLAGALVINPATQKIYLGDILESSILSINFDGTGLTTAVSNTVGVFGLALADVTAFTPTPTPTITNTPTATSTATQTATPTVAATSTNTPLPTMTATSVPTFTATPEPTATPTSEPTSPPAVPNVPIAAGNLEGTITDDGGNPLENVVVTLYDGVSPQSRSTSTRATENRVVKVTLTNANGVYRFSGLPKGEFRLEPRLDGINFTPPSMIVPSGSQAPAVEASGSIPNEIGCTTRNVAPEMIALTTSISELQQYVLSVGDKLGKSAQKKSQVRSVKRIQKSIDGILLRTDASVSQILRSSEALPLIILTCDPSRRCATNYHSHEVSLLVNKLKQLERISRSLSTVAGTLGERSSSLKPESITRRLSSKVSAVFKRIDRQPVETAECQ